MGSGLADQLEHSNAADTTSASKSLGLYYLALLLAGLAPLALAVDLPLARHAKLDAFPGDVRELLTVSEAFAHGWGVAMIALTVLILDVQRRRAVPRVLACAYGAGIMANLGKLVVARTRPNDFDFAGGVWSTFGGWAPILTSGDLGEALDHSVQSFPSGHTATAVGLAIGLSRLYPRGKWLFSFFAVLAGMQRIEVGVHYLSDTLAGAALGCLVGAICQDPRLLGRVFDRWES